MCAVNRIFGFEPRIGIALVRTFGGAMALFRQDRATLEEALGPRGRQKYLPQINAAAFDAAAIELEGLGKQGFKFTGLGEEGYPKALLDCEDPPIGLYFRGVSEPKDVFGGRPAISVVGTRDMSGYGWEWCRRLVSAMSAANEKPLIVSGLAIGIDATAHEAALNCGLPTVAVMATGIGRIYPARHRSMGERMSKTQGCALITDFPPEAVAEKVHFLRRNRIIAGLSRAVILVESKIKGGAMMTVRLASSYGRDVFALPGRLDDPNSQGCNLMIKENVAVPIGSPAALISELGLNAPSVRSSEDYEDDLMKFYVKEYSAAEAADIIKIAMAIKKNRGVSLDELCAQLDWNFPKVSSLASLLECDGFITIDLLQHCAADPSVQRNAR